MNDEKRFELESQGFHIPDDVWKRASTSTAEWLIGVGERSVNQYTEICELTSAFNAMNHSTCELQDIVDGQAAETERAHEYYERTKELIGKLDEVITDKAAEIEHQNAVIIDYNNIIAQLRKDLAYWTAEDRVCG